MADGTRFHLGTHATALDYHSMLVGDPHRVVAYERAIRRLVKPGDVVLDLGTGTGVLGLLAARRGAIVHAVESHSVATLAEAIARRNRLVHRFHVHKGDIKDMPVAEKVDLVVSDFMGRFIVDDGMLGAMQAARAWMKPGARFCPSRLTLFLAPVHMPLPAVQVFDTTVLGLDLRPAVPYANNTCYSAQLGPPSLLAHGKPYHSFEPPGDPGEFDATVEFDIGVDGPLTCFAGWFEADLADGVVLSSGPSVQTHWGQYLFPVERLQLQKGDRLEVRLRLVPPAEDPGWEWEGRVHRGGEVVATFAQESDQLLGERKVPDDPVPQALDRDGIVRTANASAEAFLAGRVAEAIAGFEAATRALTPQDDDLANALYENAALARFNLGDYGGATRDFLRALDGDPKRSLQACRYLVVSLHYEGRLHDAAHWLRLFREAHGDHPEFPRSGAH